MNAFPGRKLEDAAGAGDWCSSGIIYQLVRNKKREFHRLKYEDIEFALNFGQALASLNCYYVGARGIMYNLTKKRFNNSITQIWKGNSPISNFKNKENYKVLGSWSKICSNCKNNII